MQNAMHTRQDYMENRCTHREYYGQFVNETIKKAVEFRFGKEELTIALAQDEHLNNVKNAKNKTEEAKKWEAGLLKANKGDPRRGEYAGMGFIPTEGLDEWDKLAYFLRPAYEPKLGHIAQGWSWATGTCILKEAARQIVEGK